MAPRHFALRRAQKVRKSRTLAATLALALAFTGLTALAAPAPAAVAAAAPAFDCTVPRFFAQAEEPVGTVGLYTGSYNVQGDSVWTALGAKQTAPNVYNALGFNPVDEYLYGTIYGTASGATAGSFVRIDRNGNLTQLGVSSPALGSSYSTLWDSGEFDASGTYYVASGNAGGTTGQVNIRKITGLAGVTSASSTPRPSLTTVTLSPTPRYADFSFKDGFLWAPNYGQSSTIYRIDVNNVLGAGAGKVTSFSVPSAVLPVNSYGSAFTMTNGNLAFIGTNGYMYQISVTGAATASPTFELVSRVAAPANQRSDATNCSTSLPSHLSIEKTGPAVVMIDSTITWTITVTNDGPGITSGFVLTDALPAGLRDITAQSADTSCVITGTKTVTCNGGRLDVEGTAVVTVTATAPHTPGPLANSATVIGNEDPTPPGPSTVDTEVAVITTADHPVTIPDATPTSWPPTSTQGGTVTRSGGAFTYTPPAGFSGNDSFTYQTPSGAVTVNVRVSPLAAPASLETTVEVPVPIAAADLVALGTGTDLSLDSVGAASHGTVAIVGGQVVFTPEDGFSGAASFSYTLIDAAGLTVTDTVTVTVHNVFTPGDAVTTPHRTAKTISLAEIATTAGAALSSAGTQLVAPAAAHGTVVVNAITGGVVYTPSGGYAGDDSFTVRVYDTTGEWYQVTVEVTVLPNTVTASDDPASVDAGGFVDVDVRGNDTSASGQAFALPTVTTGPAHGTAVMQAGGTIRYTPAVGFSGEDSFGYRVCDTSTPDAVCDTATVTVTVANVFTPGTAAADGVTTPHNTGLEIPLDDIVTTTGLPIDPAGVTVTAQPSHGSVEIDPVTGAPSYTPNAGYTGDDAFTLQLCDENGDCTSATIQVEVGANTVTASDDSTTTAYTTSVDVDVRHNDTSASGQALALPTVTSGPTHGTAVAQSDGTIRYTPAAGFSGEDSFGYRVCDTSTPDAVCDTATVTVTVGNLFTSGTAVEDGVSTPHNVAVTIPLADILAASGAALDAAATTVTGQPDEGTISIDPTTGAVTYTPGAGYAGGDEFELELSDVNGATVTVTIQVTVLANTVTASDDPASVDAGGFVDVDVRGNDTSASGQAFALPTVTTGPAHGTAVVQAGGTIRYTPAAAFSGEDSFDYRVCDTSTPDAVCDTATVTVTVANVFTPGTAAVDGIATPHNTTAEIPLDDLATAAGLPVDPAGVTVTGDPSHGTVSIDPSTGVPSYTPDAGYTGDDEFTLQLCDENGDCTSVTVEVEVAANAVAAGNDSASTPLDTAVVIDVRHNDTSASGQPLAAPSVTSGPAHGTASVVAGGIRYTPDAGFTGEDAFTYRVCDTSTPDPVCDTATATVTVLNVFVSGPATVPGGASTGQGEPTTIPLDDIVTGKGAPLDPSTVRVTDGPGHGTVDYDAQRGEFAYTPDGSFAGDDAFTFEVCDESTPSQCTTVTAVVRVSAASGGGAALGATGADRVAAIAVSALGAGLLGVLLLVVRRRRSPSEG